MRHLRLLLLAALVLAVIAAGKLLPVEQWLQGLLGWINGLGALAPVAFILLYVVIALLLLPGSVLTIFAGATFGLWRGFMLVVIAANLAALVAFALARSRLRERVARWAANDPRFARLDRAVERAGFKMVLLTRLSPVFPFSLLNYFFGLTRVRLGAYALANLIGMLPGTFLYAYLGHTARSTLGGSSRLLFNLAGLAATILIVVWVTRVARRAMNEAEPETDKEAR